MNIVLMLSRSSWVAVRCRSSVVFFCTAGVCSLVSEASALLLDTAAAGVAAPTGTAPSVLTAAAGVGISADAAVGAAVGAAIDVPAAAGLAAGAGVEAAAAPVAATEGA